MVYGPAGSTYVAVNSTTVTGNSRTRYRVRFNSGIANLADLKIEVTDGMGSSGLFQPVPSREVNATRLGTADYGMYIEPISGSSTDVYVAFGNGGRTPSSGTFAAAGSAWSGIASDANWRWRVKKCVGGVPVGFGLATSSLPGLVSYEDASSFSQSFTGARSTSNTFYYSRVGKTVTITWANDVGSSCSANTLNGTGWPSALRPARTVDCPIFVQDNGSTQSTPGYLELDSAGAVTIGKSFSSGNFTNAANCGYYRGTCTYQIQ